MNEPKRNYSRITYEDSLELVSVQVNDYTMDYATMANALLALLRLAGYGDGWDVVQEMMAGMDRPDESINPAQMEQAALLDNGTRID